MPQAETLCTRAPCSRHSQQDGQLCPEVHLAQHCPPWNFLARKLNTFETEAVQLSAHRLLAVPQIRFSMSVRLASSGHSVANKSNGLYAHLFDFVPKSFQGQVQQTDFIRNYFCASQLLSPWALINLNLLVLLMKCFSSLYHLFYFFFIRITT